MIIDFSFCYETSSDQDGNFFTTSLLQLLFQSFWSRVKVFSMFLESLVSQSQALFFFFLKGLYCLFVLTLTETFEDFESTRLKVNFSLLLYVLNN